MTMTNLIVIIILEVIIAVSFTKVFFNKDGINMKVFAILLISIILLGLYAIFCGIGCF